MQNAHQAVGLSFKRGGCVQFVIAPRPYMRGLLRRYSSLIKSHPNRFLFRLFNCARAHIGWLGATSWAVSMLATPVIIALCRRKSTRLTAVIGGLVLALGILFASFATQLHQVAFSYGECEAYVGRIIYMVAFRGCCC